MHRAFWVLLWACVACQPRQPGAERERAAAPVDDAAPHIDEATTPTGAARLTIGTYNVHADRAGNAETLAALDQLDVDVLFVQEASDAWQTRLRRDLGERYPHTAFVPWRQRWGGLAILSRHPIREARVLKPHAGPFPAWHAMLDTPAGSIQVLHVHLFPPIRLFRELGWVRAYMRSQQIHRAELEPWIDELSDHDPTLIVGDLNEAPGGDAVTWLGGLGFAPALDPSIATWRWQTDLGPVRLQLDHVLHRGGLRVIEARAVEAGGSDHFPVVVAFAPSGV